MSVLVSGRVDLPANSPPFEDALMVVSLEETGLMDMPSTVLVERQSTVSYNGQPLAFSLNGEVRDTSGPISLRVHISMDQSGDVQKGDYLTKHAHKVSLDQTPQQVTVKVDRV